MIPNSRLRFYRFAIPPVHQIVLLAGHRIGHQLQPLVARGAVATIIVFQILSFGTEARADSVCVTASKANLRKGPGMSFPVAWEVGQYMPFDRLSKKGSWTQVKDLDGETNWISSSVISNRINCLVVRTKMASLRQAANNRAPAAELSFADRYTPFQKLDRDEAWIQVQDEFKAKYWINETNVWIPVMRSRVEF